MYLMLESNGEVIDRPLCAGSRSMGLMKTLKYATDMVGLTQVASDLVVVRRALQVFNTHRWAVWERVPQRDIFLEEDMKEEDWAPPISLPAIGGRLPDRTVYAEKAAVAKEGFKVTETAGFVRKAKLTVKCGSLHAFLVFLHFWFSGVFPPGMQLLCCCLLWRCVFRPAVRFLWFQKLRDASELNMRHTKELDKIRDLLSLDPNRRWASFFTFVQVIHSAEASKVKTTKIPSMPDIIFLVTLRNQYATFACSDTDSPVEVDDKTLDMWGVRQSRAELKKQRKREVEQQQREREEQDRQKREKRETEEAQERQQQERATRARKLEEEKAAAAALEKKERDAQTNKRLLKETARRLGNRETIEEFNRAHTALGLPLLPLSDSDGSKTESLPDDAKGAKIYAQLVVVAWYSIDLCGSVCSCGQRGWCWSKWSPLGLSNSPETWNARNNPKQAPSAKLWGPESKRHAADSSSCKGATHKAATGRLGTHTATDLHQ